MPTINWKAVVSASLIAGFIFLILDLALVAIVGGESLWGPPRMIGAILLGEGVLPPPATFHLSSFLAALVVHLALSLIYGSIFAWVANKATGNGSVSATPKYAGSTRQLDGPGSDVGAVIETVTASVTRNDARRNDPIFEGRVARSILDPTRGRRRPQTLYARNLRSWPRERPPPAPGRSGRGPR